MRLRALLVLSATLAFVLSPLLNPGFGGYDPSLFPVPVSDPPVLPAGWAFPIIWSVIYLWLVAMAGFGLWRRAEDPGWDATRGPLIVALGVGAVWLTVASVSAIWATVLIWVMTVAALVALLRVPERDALWLRAPVGLFAGWLTAASCVSSGVLATGYAAAPFGPVGWAVAWLSVALAIAVAMLRVRPVATYGIAVVWALVAVTARNGADLVGLFAAGAAVAVAALTLRGLRSWRSSRRRPARYSAPR